ncbi:hypothetical protein MYCTH_89967 [Thermothelomyces thermophilus ATCC 42464]|uniref:Uncharacterized protein n=1 Tax=Thermothelomyces thermophilus (strain ATCC 42464 / BCRC 31852 / DSM 1799) TaxID=573729 RepID=G2QM37_THET4|nr:uncharacterized protein MYCTH_89967 [Thermothelomyces thermophilus ATCC 42464]AEO61017.1 hypothetical protein MYCTH_89967 [Thermothelomyces thermophilus ATCC 42464]
MPEQRSTVTTLAAPGSLADIIRREPRLFVLPPYWTYNHSRVLGARFWEQPAITRPFLEQKLSVPPKPSEMAKALILNLDTLLSWDTLPERALEAMEHVMATFFPATLHKPQTDARLKLYFGERVFNKAVYVSSLWTSSSTDGSASTILSASVLAYVPRERLRSKLVAPADADRDPHIVATLLAMAQAHFYKETSLTPPVFTPAPLFQRPVAHTNADTPFYDVTGQIITHQGEGESANFVVYTAVVIATFLRRFMFPYEGPDSKDSKSGMDISVRKVKVFPILGLRERLVRALLPELVEPYSIYFWGPLVERSRKRKRAGSGSFEEERSVA